MAIIKKDRNWDILFDQIVKGNVIPVIGPELVELGDTTSLQKIIDEFAETCGINRGEKTSFSLLVYGPKFNVWAEGAVQSEYVEKNAKQPSNSSIQTVTKRRCPNPHQTIQYTPIRNSIRGYDRTLSF